MNKIPASLRSDSSDCRFARTACRFASESVPISSEYAFVASLAFLLDRALEKKLKSPLDLSSKEAWQILKTVRVVEIELGHGEQSVR